MNQDLELWCVATSTGDVTCLMRTCCSGAELQVVAQGSVVLRELYPMKTDLYERARMLEAEYRHGATGLRSLEAWRNQQ